MVYLSLKITHVSCVALSYTLFVARGVWMLRGSSLLQQRWVKIVPHVVDTVLLASAIAMAVMIRQYPFIAPWLTAKVVGSFSTLRSGPSLKRGKSQHANRASRQPCSLHRRSCYHPKSDTLVSCGPTALAICGSS